MGKNWKAQVAFPQTHFLGVSVPWHSAMSKYLANETELCFNGAQQQWWLSFTLNQQRNLRFFQKNHLLGTMDFTGWEQWPCVTSGIKYYELICQSSHDKIFETPIFDLKIYNISVDNDLNKFPCQMRSVSCNTLPTLLAVCTELIIDQTILKYWMERYKFTRNLKLKFQNQSLLQEIKKIWLFQ